MSDEPIPCTIVTSVLGGSGTTLTMRMLAAAGVPVIVERWDVMEAPDFIQRGEFDGARGKAFKHLMSRDGEHHPPVPEGLPVEWVLCTRDPADGYLSRHVSVNAPLMVAPIEDLLEAFRRRVPPDRLVEGRFDEMIGQPESWAERLIDHLGLGAVPKDLATVVRRR